MHTDHLRRELRIAGAAFGFGFFVLPVAIYWVGLRFIGEYAPDAGFLDLAERIWSDFLTLRPAAWLLVLSPYLVVQAMRLLLRVWRARPSVTPVTNPHDRP